MIAGMAVLHTCQKCEDHIIIFCNDDQQISHLYGYLQPSNQKTITLIKKEQNPKSWVGQAHATENIFLRLMDPVTMGSANIFYLLMFSNLLNQIITFQTPNPTHLEYK